MKYWQEQSQIYRILKNTMEFAIGSFASVIFLVIFHTISRTLLIFL